MIRPSEDPISSFFGHTFALAEMFHPFGFILPRTGAFFYLSLILLLMPAGLLGIAVFSSFKPSSRFHIPAALFPWRRRVKPS